MGFWGGLGKLGLGALSGLSGGGGGGDEDGGGKASILTKMLGGLAGTAKQMLENRGAKKPATAPAPTTMPGGMSPPGGGSIPGANPIEMPTGINGPLGQEGKHPSLATSIGPIAQRILAGRKAAKPPVSKPAALAKKAPMAPRSATMSRT